MTTKKTDFAFFACVLVCGFIAVLGFWILFHRLLHLVDTNLH